MSERDRDASTRRQRESFPAKRSVEPGRSERDALNETRRRMAAEDDEEDRIEAGRQALAHAAVHGWQPKGGSNR